MQIIELSRVLVLAAIFICVLGIGLRLRSIFNRPYQRDLSRPQGNPLSGILYAFTLGMAPWEKESTRIHWLAYLRGILFHIGIFAALGILALSPWLSRLPSWVTWSAIVMTGSGALAGFAGIAMRQVEANLRALSLLDDYLSVFITSLFTGLAFLVLLVPGSLALFYIVTALMLIYIPISKIRHCVYFFFSKFIFGRNFGHRGVIGQVKSKYAE
jgi:hypothetical protein